VLLLKLCADLDTADEINKCIYDILNQRSICSTLSHYWYVKDANKCPVFTEGNTLFKLATCVCKRLVMLAHDCAVLNFISVIVMLIFKLIFLKNGWISYSLVQDVQQAISAEAYNIFHGY
jgi:hypothetical protein